MIKNIQIALAELILISFLYSPVLLAQDMAPEKQAQIKDDLIVLTGEVTDAATGKPLSATRVEALNVKNFTCITDSSGHFTLKIPRYVENVAISASDYGLVIFPVRANYSPISIRLYSDKFKSYYQEMPNITAKSSSSEFRNSSSLSIDNEIASQLGTDVRSVMRSGSLSMGATMFIRGYNSLNVNAQPLIIVDGVAWDTQEDRLSLHQGYFNNTIAGIDPADIARVTVLKNGTSLYGIKGGNGVIEIETKRGVSMATKFDISMFTGTTLQPKSPQMMDADQYRLYASDLWGSLSQYMITPDFLNDDPSFFYYKKYHNNTDWKDYVYRNGFTQGYNIAVQGGDDIAMYNLSIGYTGDQSTLKTNDLARFNMRFNSDIHLGRVMTTKFDISYMQTKRNMSEEGLKENSNATPEIAPNYLALIKAPIFSPYQYDNSGNTTHQTEDEDYLGLANPVSVIDHGLGTNNYTEFNVTATPRIELSRFLSLSEKFSYSLSNVTEKLFIPMGGVPSWESEDNYSVNNELKSQSARQNSFFSDLRLDWKRQFLGHDVRFFGGLRYQADRYDSDYLSGYNTGSDQMTDINSALTDRKVNGLDDGWKSMGFYAQGEYNFREKYFLQGTLTSETSSRFGPDARSGFKAMNHSWGIFPSVQAGWLISSEAFFRMFSFINMMKITAGYDQSGNDKIQSNAAKSYFSTVRYMDNSIGLSLSSIANSKIQWESTRRCNVGADMALLHDRLGLTLNIYRSNTDNLLTLKSADYIAGIDNYWYNGGSLKNTGYEFSVTVRVINGKNMTWELGGSVAHYKNEVTSLPEGESFTTHLYGADILSAVGQPAGVFYGYKAVGVFSTAKEAAEANLVQLNSTGAMEPFQAGDVKFLNHDASDNIIDAKDKVIIGDPNPKFYGSFFTTLSYKYLSLNLLFNYSYGNDVYNALRSQLESGSSFYNQTTALQNRWVNEGQITSIPRAVYGDATGNSRFSSRWIEDGSYLRLKTVTLSYRLPMKLNWIQGANIWISANNLLTFTKYLGSDPEFSVGNGTLSQGIDCGLLPQSRSFFAGIKFNL